MSARSASLAPAVASSGRTTLFVCCCNLFAIVFLQRIVMPLGNLQVSCLIPIAVGSLLYLSLARHAVVDLTKLCWLGVLLLAAMASHAAGKYSFSVPSFLLLVVLY